jgi:predicted RNA-binding Zn-ribbon protein involved in translation (DUF1610 family)
VENLPAATCPVAPAAAVSTSQTISPTANRRILGLDTSEEYELVVMRLCAGEGGLVRTEPEAARTRFAEELRGANPDLGVLRSFESVLLTLRPEHLARALGPAPVEYAPPEPEPPAADEPMVEPPLPDLPDFPGLEALAEPDASAEPDPDPETVPEPEPATRCAYCGGRLPTGRTVNFCPHCGQNQVMVLCPVCRSEVEPGWKHCVNCGSAVGESQG